MTKIILGEHIKGGTGLTTILSETVKELSKTSKILIIDVGSVTNLQNQYTHSNNIPVLSERKEPLHCTDNIHVARVTNKDSEFLERYLGARENESLGKLNNIWYNREYDYIIIDTHKPLQERSLLYWFLLSKDVTILNVIESDRFSIDNHILNVKRVDTPRANKFNRVLIMNKVQTKDTLLELEESEESIEAYLHNQQLITEYIPRLIHDKFMVINYSLSFPEETLYGDGFVNKKHDEYVSGDFKALVQLKSVIKSLSTINK